MRIYPLLATLGALNLLFAMRVWLLVTPSMISDVVREGVVCAFAPFHFITSRQRTTPHLFYCNFAEKTRSQMNKYAVCYFHSGLTTKKTM